ncbi:kinesin-domain-containing protein [Coniophora puteana RWD-64-598 SS2]|uniref:Kinesin-like protein n=1 Tax=Coniophora puteana (strain RWD-64-598) TaxID=741705 RepID=A0A5M3MAY9_CONPW|nr:kinesin-domain-containing protein [Coniophora puteana RWD-64-598 SS2]EIW76156.1 kinesin-domain-containing protein [Coniophora puteana RWD-64-598 SS2]
MVSAGSITVAVRVRPPTSWEARRLPETTYETTLRGDGTLATPMKPVTQSAPLRNIVQIVDDRILTFDPREQDPARAFVERGFMPPGTKRYKDRRFMFDKVLDSQAQQPYVYEATAKPLLSGLLEGYNATVFAYGATGCGKTHTISGTEDDPGIIYLAMSDLFQRIEDRQDEWSTEVSVTFLEIYNEEIRDLLAEPGTPTPRGGLQIREDKSVKVVGLSELHPASADQVKEIVLLGNSRRTQSPTHANETSSRSHAVLQVHLTQAPRTASLTEQRTVATLSIIDLAGSERAAATTNMGQRMVEGANINKSLLALGNCINALCESGGAVRHVPYRNSKLTRLLKFSLGGNCKTVMVVCVAPTSAHFDDTHNTLVYAERATKIKTKVVTRNVVNVDRHVGQYVQAINRLNDEVRELKEKLAGKLGKEAEIANRKKSQAKEEVERVRKDLSSRTEQTQPSIADGASCSGKISVAEIKLQAIRVRLAQIASQASSSSLSPELGAERALLQALAAPEEQVVKPDSALRTRYSRSLNSLNMFEATLRAVSERRSDKLDDVSVESVRAEAHSRRAEMDQIKAEAEKNAVKESFNAQTEMVVSLLGMVGRCTVMLMEASKVLRTAVEEGNDGMEGTVRSMSASLKNIADQNDEAFNALVGQSTAVYTLQEAPASFSSFSRHSFAAPPAPVQQQPQTKAAHRLSYNPVMSPPRRHYKSPRKSIRQSIGQPYRRAGPEKEKKSVQWRDEAGQGNLVDSSFRKPAVTVMPSSDSGGSIGRPPSSLGSESEWEDERTEDSFNLNFFATSSREVPQPRSSLSSSLRSSLGGRTTRSMSKAKAPTLGSVVEADEQGSPRKAPPLSDRDMNHMISQGEGGNSGSSLRLSKGKGRQGSPARRIPASSIPTPQSTKHARRRSTVGPMRSEKTRRRSSMIPQPALASGDEPGESISANSGPRRVEVGRSPKRPKRLSLMGNASRTLRARSTPGASSLPDSNSSSFVGDMSMRSGKPTWK